MEQLQPRTGGSSQLSTTALAAILTGVGIVMLGLLVGLVFLLVRAVRTHKRLLNDLEERGVSLAQQRGAKRDPVSEPRSVLRRNTILPFNARSGWGTLQSVETINPSEQQQAPPQYVPPESTGGKSTRLSWSFSARRSSSKAVRMGKLKVPRLSTVIEDPKMSPLVTVIGTPRLDSPVPLDSKGRPSSDLSLLQDHPAFRSRQEGPNEATQSNAMRPESLRRSLTAALPIPAPESQPRANRSMSVADIPQCATRIEAESSLVSRFSRSNLGNNHTRSSSVCSQASGNAPESTLPPLPLEIMEISRTKNVNRSSCLLSRSPSKISVSSFESAGSSILANHESLMLPPNPDVPSQKPNKRGWKATMASGTRPFRDTLSLHRENQSPHIAIESNPPQLPSLDILQRDSQFRSGPSHLIKSSSTQSMGRTRALRSGATGISSPSSSPLTVRSLATPKRNLNSRVDSSGSPQQRQKPLVLQSVSGNEGSPKRQLSQTSTRSSNGNPFQWDPTPLSSRKPSALKGSPSARKGHRRQNCVRISLAPTILGPVNVVPNVSQMNDIKEESPTLSNKKNASIDSSSSTIRNIPQFSTSTVVPEVQTGSNLVGDSSTVDSNSLSLLDFDEDDPDSPALAKVLPEFLKHERNSLSYGSISSIPIFPMPGSNADPKLSTQSPAPNVVNEPPKIPNTPFLPSYPFEGDSPRSSTSAQRLKADTSNKVAPQLPDPTSTNPQIFLPTINIDIISGDSISPSDIDENEDGILLKKDSPPRSPLTEMQSASPVQDRSIYNLPITDITIQEDVSDTIDPSLLIKVNTSIPSNGANKDDEDAMKTLNSSRNSFLALGVPGTRLSTLEPLLEGEAFQKDGDATNASHRISITSLYGPASSAPSLLGCSFSPIPLATRGSPPRPLRSSILKLRRMNSDCERTGRAERRYLHLGKDHNILLPNEEQWLEEVEGEEVEDEWDVEEDRKLLGSTLDSWEYEATMQDKKDEANAALCSNSSLGKDTSNYLSSSSPQTGTPAPTPISTPNTTPIVTSTVADRSSSIWEDGEKFWTEAPSTKITTNTTTMTIMPKLSLVDPNPNTTSSKNPFPPTSPLLPQHPSRASPTPSPRSTPKSRPSDFLNSPSQEDIIPNNTSPDIKNLSTQENSPGGASGTNQNRKRSILGIGTPNVGVRIQVQQPSPPAGVGVSSQTQSPIQTQSPGSTGSVKSSNSKGSGSNGSVRILPGGLYDGDEWGA